MQVTPDQVWEALKVMDHATVSMCEAMVEAFGTQREAAARLGVSTVHFNRMKQGHAKASLEMLEVMCGTLPQEAFR